MIRGLENDSFIAMIFEKMRSNHDLCGNYELTGNTIEWEFNDEFTISISRDYFGISKKLFGKIENPLTHWHPDDDDLYDDICRLGTRGNITVIHKTILYDGVIYSGPETECRIKRKWLFGKYYYLRAKS